MDVFNPHEFARVKAKAEALYKTIVKAFCPALKSDVHFSSDGFHHLRFNGARAERTKAVQQAKMLCLQEALDVIRKTTTIQEYRVSLHPVGHGDKNGFRQTKRIEYFAFHAITDLVKSRRINVVVRRIGEGNFHFWSVMPSWKEERINDSQIVRKIGGGWMLDA
ncbi:MAG: hypothetical protein ABIK13_03955 [Patescibacteria group bacterium]